MWRVVFILLVLAQSQLYARDNGQWKYEEPDISEWYRSLMQPDAPLSSCCGEADAYWADMSEMNAQGELVAIITDTRPDEPRQRPHIEPGTKIIVPANKIRKPPIPNPAVANKLRRLIKNDIPCSPDDPIQYTVYRASQPLLQPCDMKSIQACS